MNKIGKVCGPGFGLYLILGIMSSVMPFILFGLPLHPYKYAVFIMALVLFLVVVFRGFVNYDFFGVVVGFGQLVVLLIEMMRFGDAGLSLVAHFGALIICLMYLSELETFKRWVKILADFILIISAISLLSFVLYLFGFVGMSEVMRRPGHEGQAIYMFGFSFTNAIFPVGERVIPRVAGFFDEPGAFALMVTYGIILDAINRGAGWRRYLMLAAGLSSVSFAFIVLLLPICYFVFNERRFVGVMAIMSGVFFVFVVASSSGDLGDYLDDRVFQRFERIESEGLSGHNRADVFVVGFESFLRNPVFGLGTIGNPGYGPSIFGPLSSYGIIGFLFLYWVIGFLFLKSISGRDLFMFISVSVVMLGYMHRPMYVGFNSALMLYTLARALWIRRSLSFSMA